MSDARWVRSDVTEARIKLRERYGRGGGSWLDLPLVRSQGRTRGCDTSESAEHLRGNRGKLLPPPHPPNSNYRSFENESGA